MSEDNNWVKTGEAKEILGIHHNTLYKWIRDGKITAYRVPEGRSWRFKKKDLLELR